MRFEVTKGSGRAKCKLCNKIIEKEEDQVTAYAYMSQGSVHLICLTNKALEVQK